MIHSQRDHLNDQKSKDHVRKGEIKLQGASCEGCHQRYQQKGSKLYQNDLQKKKKDGTKWNKIKKKLKCWVKSGCPNSAWTVHTVSLLSVGWAICPLEGAKGAQLRSVTSGTWSGGTRPVRDTAFPSIPALGDPTHVAWLEILTALRAGHSACALSNTSLKTCCSSWHGG